MIGENQSMVMFGQTMWWWESIMVVTNETMSVMMAVKIREMGKEMKMKKKKWKRKRKELFLIFKIKLGYFCNLNKK